jgi:hypothetical protein
MMRIFGLVIVIILAVIVAAWIGGAIVADRGMKRIGEEIWPAGLGTLASVETRYPLQKTNDAARRLVALAKPLGIPFDSTGSSPDATRKAIGEYVKAEHGRAESTISEPPPEVLAYFTAHTAEVDALRDHLLHGGAIVWERDLSKGFDASVPNLLGHMQVMRLLTARALVRARENDVGAWDDLHAAFRIAQILEPRPELISQLIALAIARSVNAAAWKLPQTADAAWFQEVQAIDHRRLLAGAYQYEMWMMWQKGESTMNGVPGVIGRPYLRWSIVDMAERQRAAMEKLAAVTTCGNGGESSDDFIPRWNVIAAIAMPGQGAWQRASRSVAEREATMNAMRIAQGQPIVAQSACSDGAWRFENDRLSFSREIPKSTESEMVMPLSLAIPARATRQST